MPTVKVKGMSCQHCVMSVTKALKAVAGIGEVDINLQTGEVTYTETKPVDPAMVRQAITMTGFEVL